MLLTSSTDSQLSWEDTKAGQGLYTHNIIEGIKSGEADIDDDGYIDTEDLGKYTKSTFKGNQTPLYNVKGLSGSLVIAKAGKTSRLVRADRINSIAKGWFLEDELTAKQLELIKRVAKTKRTQLTADQAKIDDLLNRIDAESLSAAQFMVALSEIEGSNTQEQISEGRTSGGSNSEEPPTKAPPSEQINIIEHVRGTTEARRRSNWTPRKTSPFGEEFDSVGALICGE